MAAAGAAVAAAVADGDVGTTTDMVEETRFSLQALPNQPVHRQEL